MSVAAGFIIFRRMTGRSVEYLLLQTSYGEHHWTPPKGHLDNDETPLEAAKRETKEEAGFAENDLEHYEAFEDKISYNVNGKPKSVYYYLARVKNNQPKIILSEEHQGWAWSTLKDACDLIHMNSIYDRICSSNMIIISQQRDEPDLKPGEKYAILDSLYKTKPAQFIYRFGSLLTDEELHEHFDPNADYVRQAVKSNHRRRCANRRYTYMQQLLADGSYFSDEVMRERSPLLYEQMIGKYQYNSGAPQQLATRTAPGLLSDFYMQHLEAITYRERLTKELENEQHSLSENQFDNDKNDESKAKCSNAEINLYREEFIAIQKEKFLNGEDFNIDYTSIDNNETLDDTKIRDHDEEERYFDDEEPYTYENK